MSKEKGINHFLKHELSLLISSNIALENGLITITKVKCSEDLSEATIMVSVLPENIYGTALKELRKNNHEFARLLRRKSNLRKVPKFNWKIDSHEKRVDDINKEINKGQSHKI